MSTASILAGLGAGAMAGLSFMQQKQNQDAALAQRQQVVDMQKQELGMKQTEFDQKQSDRDLDQWMDQQYRDAWANPDYKSDWERSVGFAQSILPRAKQDQIALANKTTEALRQKFGVQAVEQLKAGELTGINSLLGKQMPGWSASTDGKMISIRDQNGAVKQQLDQRGLMGFLALDEAQKVQQAQIKASLDTQKEIGQMGKTQAEIAELESKARKNDRWGEPTAEYDENGNLVVSPGSGGGHGGKSTPPPGAMLTADAYLKRFGVKADAEPAERIIPENGLRNYQALRRHNPQFNTVDGNNVAFGLSMALATGQVQPKTDFDPSTMSWKTYVVDPSSRNGRTYLLDADVNPRTIKVQDGKPLFSQSDIDQAEISALKNFASAQPEIYRSAVSLAQDKGLTTAELQAAAAGRPVSSNSGQPITLPPAVANAALMVRARGVDKQAEPEKRTSGLAIGGVRRQSVQGGELGNRPYKLIPAGTGVFGGRQFIKQYVDGAREMVSGDDAEREYILNK